MFHTDLFIPTGESYLLIYKVQNTIFSQTLLYAVLDRFLTTCQIYLACFLMTFDKTVRVTPKQNGSVTVINRAENTKNWKEIDNNWAETRATLLPNTTHDHHRREPCYTSKRVLNQFLKHGMRSTNDHVSFMLAVRTSLSTVNYYSTAAAHSRDHLLATNKIFYVLQISPTATCHSTLLETQEPS
jgi:hypothetical protein